MPVSKASAEVRNYERSGIGGGFERGYPRVGQFYNGRILAGIFWLIITPGLWIGTGGLLGWTAHVISSYFAYRYARDHRVR